MLYNGFFNQSAVEGSKIIKAASRCSLSLHLEASWQALESTSSPRSQQLPAAGLCCCRRAIASTKGCGSAASVPHAAHGGTNHANVHTCCALHNSCTAGYRQSSVQSPASTRGELIAEAGRALLLRCVLSCGPRRPCKDCSPTRSGMRRESDLGRLDISWDFCLFVCTGSCIRIHLELRCMEMHGSCD